MQHYTSPPIPQGKCATVLVIANDGETAQAHARLVASYFRKLPIDSPLRVRYRGAFVAIFPVVQLRKHDGPMTPHGMQDNFKYLDPNLELIGG